MIYICWAISSPASRKHVRELDLKHAIQLISLSPGVQLHCGTIEIRPAADISGMMRERDFFRVCAFALFLLQAFQVIEAMPYR